MNDQHLTWVLSGDIAIQYQVHRDILDSDAATLSALRQRIATEGWGAHFLSLRKDDGHWGRGFYQPKWTSTHYTLLDLKNLGLPCDNREACESTAMALGNPPGIDGGISYWGPKKRTDVCVNGMLLSFASYFLPHHERLPDIVDYLLDVQMPDGGWNCRYARGAVHSSMHSTISVLEGLLEFRNTGNTYRRREIRSAEKKGREFLLEHRLFRSHRTGEIIDEKMLRLSYPSRWRYDILRALDYFRQAGAKRDSRMDDAFEVLLSKRNTDGTWPLQEKHAGTIHFTMERVGKPSRWNTLRALRVLRHFKKENV